MSIFFLKENQSLPIHEGILFQLVHAHLFCFYFNQKHTAKENCYFPHKGLQL